jgi:hypothetical protein
MKTKPTNGTRVRCIDASQLRIPTNVGAEGTCCGDVWMHPEMVWVTFDGHEDTQHVLWETELDELRETNSKLREKGYDYVKPR